MQRGDDAVEVHGLEPVLPAQLLGDGRPEVDVEADVFIALLELEGHEGGIGGDQQFLVGGVGVAGGGDDERSQGCFEQMFHMHASSRSWTNRPWPCGFRRFWQSRFSRRPRKAPHRFVVIKLLGQSAMRCTAALLSSKINMHF
ncbi:hypothetical protein D9M70_495420 [compost metagenome]